MIYIEYYDENGQTAFLGMVNEQCYKAGIEGRITSGFRTFEEAYAAYEHYKEVIKGE